MNEVMKVAVSDSNAEVRRAALAILPTLPISDAAKVESLVPGDSSRSGEGSAGGVRSARDVEERTRPRRRSAAFFDELVAGKLPPPCNWIWSMRCRRTASAALQARLEASQKARSAREPRRRVPRCAAGRAAAPDPGRTRSSSIPRRQCTRCHTVRNAGADVGPNLTGVAQRLTGAQILESLLEPNARVAPGYGTVGVTLRNGQRVDGTLQEETATHVRPSVGHTASRAAHREDRDRRTNEPGVRNAADRPDTQAPGSPGHRRLPGDAAVRRSRGYEGTGSTPKTRSSRRRHEEEYVLFSEKADAGTARSAVGGGGAQDR